MVEKKNYMKKLIENAINASIDFEALMDSIDFDSWLDNDTCDGLKKEGQDISPFKNYKNGKNELEQICKRMMSEGDRVGDKSLALDKDLIHQLFEAKHERLNARTSSNKEDEERLYKKSLQILHIALNKIQKSNIDNVYWNILLFNDLSICYAGLENSSISRGYAEEARKIIENENCYKIFDENLNSNTRVDFKNEEFVSIKLYDLYTIAIFNQAQAELRSYMTSEAERNFKKIINYANQPIKGKNCLLNFNYYSAIGNLGDLYIDQGRGKEAVELLDRIIESVDYGDIRYSNAYLNKITALIDQSEYDEAQNLLCEKFIKKNRGGLTLRKGYKVTASGFKGMNNYVRCQIEKVKNTLKAKIIDKKRELGDAKNFITENIELIKERKQEGTETKAYKYLSEINQIIGENEERKKNLIKFLSKGKVNGFEELCKYNDEKQWINDCDDLDALESVFNIICCSIHSDQKSVSMYHGLLEKFKDKIMRECYEKGQLSRAEKIMKKYNEAHEEVEKEKGIVKYEENCFKPDEDNKLNREDIRKRLDRNEKVFDSVLFGRSKMKRNDILAEVIMLRRWNSFSPGLTTGNTGSLGGGYFLRVRLNNSSSEEISEDEKVHNIIIDPGYNFIQNFLKEKFNIDDIDTIIITHSHLDHCAELLPIMDLIYQINKRYDKYYKEEKRDKKKVNLCLSKGAYNKFSSYIMDPDWQKQLKNVIIIENLPGSKWLITDGLTISAIPTPHMDLGGVKAIGLKIEVKGESNNLCLGFTGDTPFYKNIEKDFCGCDVLCVHLGSIKYSEIGYSDERYKDLERELRLEEQEQKFKDEYAQSNHLLFFGTKALIKDCVKENNLVIVGEFGEELKYGLRKALCDKFSPFCSQCLPCDIGLYIAIDKRGTKKVRCNFCDEFVDQKEITTFSYGKEDAIQYICLTCDKTLTELQKQAIIEHRLTRH